VSHLSVFDACRMYFAQTSQITRFPVRIPDTSASEIPVTFKCDIPVAFYKSVFHNRQAAARYQALASIIPGRNRFSWNLSF